MDDRTSIIDDTDAYEAALKRRVDRLAVYLRWRGRLGLLLVALGAVVLVGAGVVLAAAVGWVWIPELARWTQGFDAVLAVFMPAALGGLLVRSGLKYWRHRRADDGDAGCLVA